MRLKPRVERVFDVEAVVRPSIRDTEELAIDLGEALIGSAHELRKESRLPLVTPRPLRVILFLEVLWSGFGSSGDSVSATDRAGARATLSAAVSLVLRLTGQRGEPGQSREHAFLCALAERHLERGDDAPLERLLPEILEPPFERIGALLVDDYVPLAKRKELAADLNTLLASPSFAAWRRGPSLDVGAWMAPTEDGRTPATVFSVAHLDDDEREIVLGVVLEEVLTWVRSRPGTSHLRGLVVFDELYGFLPPHPRQPATKRPLVALMKQARAYGVGEIRGLRAVHEDAGDEPAQLEETTLASANLPSRGLRS